MYCLPIQQRTDPVALTLLLATTYISRDHILSGASRQPSPSYNDYEHCQLRIFYPLLSNRLLLMSQTRQNPSPIMSDVEQRLKANAAARDDVIRHRLFDRRTM